METRAPAWAGARHDRRRGGARPGLRGDRVLQAATALGAAWLAAFTAATWATRDSEAGQRVVGELVYLVPIACAAALSVLVASRARSQRWFWRLLAASNVLWLGGDLVWAGYTYLLHRDAPFPSVADAVYLGSYALVPVAVVVGFGASGRLVSVRGLLDAAVIAAALGFAGWQLLVEPQLGGALDAATLTGIAYPLLGVVIVVTLLAVAPSHRAVPLPVVGVALAFAVSAVTDAGYTWLVVLHSYLSGRWLNLGWQLEAVLMCLALLMALRHEDDRVRERRRGRDLTFAPVVASTGAVLALLLHDVRDGVVAPAGVLATLTVLVTMVVRFAVSLADLRRTTLRLDAALGEQERLAVTDGLTGLHNRRFISEQLDLAQERVHREATALSIVALDLDDFKRINDTHGHAAGDAVLVEVARRLRTALRGTDVLGRTGGEEFLVLAPGTGLAAAVEVAERLRSAVREAPISVGEGRSLTVTLSAGAVELEAGEGVGDLVRRADRALYAAKDAGRDRVVASDPPRRVVHEVEPAVLAVLERVADAVDARAGRRGHSAAVARWAERLAEALGLAGPERAQVALAARLHDVQVLDGPAGRSPDHGAIVLRALLPDGVLELVGAHGERFDGTGLPRGLAGRAIPLGARIIAAADACAALVATDLHREGGSGGWLPASTERELARRAGTVLDPEVVAALLSFGDRDAAVGAVGAPL